MEYQAAQASAQHHDQLVWVVTAITWAGNLAALAALTEMRSRSILAAMIVALGIALNLHAWFVQRQLRTARNHKYRRCQEIEATFGMKQHRSLKWGEKLGTYAYRAITTLFVMLWLAGVQTVFFPSEAKPHDFSDLEFEARPSDFEGLIE